MLRRWLQVASFCVVASPLANLMGEDDATALGALFDQTRQSILAAMNQRDIPGVAIAVVDRDRVLWMEAFGTGSRATGEPLSTSTVFSIQSTSKVFTAVAVMMAVEDGTLELDAPITEYLPRFSVNSRHEEGPQDKITLRRLLSHTAGLTHEAPIGNNWDNRSPSFRAHAESISVTWLLFPVGSRFAYSNLGFDLAGYLLQEATGTAFEAFVEDRIFRPLEMNSSFIDTRERNGTCANCATGHASGFAGIPLQIPMAAAGGVRTTAEDGARFLQFLLNQGKTNSGRRLLDPKYLRELYRAHARDARWGDRLHAYGLGVFSLAEGETYAISHNGGGRFGFLCAMKWYPEYGIGMMLLINSYDAAGVEWELGWDLLKQMVASGSGSRVEGVDRPEPAESFLSAPIAVVDDIPTEAERSRYAGLYEVVHGGEWRPSESSFDNSFGIFEIDDDLYFVSSPQLGDPTPQRLTEHVPGLLFNEVTGEAFDFRRQTPTWRNLEIRRRK